jgi:hypothetical protein
MYFLSYLVLGTPYYYHAFDEKMCLIYRRN